ncbi:MAG: hypothetical protein IK093_17705 [Ruminiclostridium sp.]|nr:hypothetical protein [Ruminiclostridium sp.]
MIDTSKLGIKNIDGHAMFSDIDRTFDKLENTTIKWSQFKEECLGTVMATSCCANELVLTDTKLEDVISVNPEYRFRSVCVHTDNLWIGGVRPCRKGEFRGEVKWLKKDAIHLTHTVFNKNYTTFVNEHLPIYQIVNDNKIYYDTPIITERDRVNPNYQEIQNSMISAYVDTHILLCLAWEDYFQWKVRVKMPEWKKSVEIWINPANIKEVFRLRDIPDGSQRRKALKHIVSAHTRTLKSGERIEIMRYLRGKERFSQNGYELTVIPSKDDVKTLGKKV